MQIRPPSSWYRLITSRWQLSQQSAHVATVLCLGWTLNPSRHRLQLTLDHRRGR
ncbi:hypothetical protein ACFPRL_20560 [Pseudoclavibacter helvolus]